MYGSVNSGFLLQSQWFVSAEDKLDGKEQVKGGERRITQVFEEGRELATKFNKKRRGAGQKKRTVLKKKRTVSNSKNRNSLNKRGVSKRTKPGNRRKKVTRTSKNNNRTGSYGMKVNNNRTPGSYGMKKNESRKKDNDKPNKKGNKDKKGKEKRNKAKKKNKKKKSSTAATMLYYPNFDIMACVADGMPPPYFSPMYFHTSEHECCAIHFSGVVTECIMKSMSNSGYILAVHHTGGVSSGGKSGKSGGKSGKSEVVEPWSPANLGWGGAMILETEEPTYYPSYFPTSLPTSTPTTYMPTTYIPT